MFIYDSGSVTVIFSGILKCIIVSFASLVALTSGPYMYRTVPECMRYAMSRACRIPHPECEGRDRFRMHQACHEPRMRVTHRILYQMR